MRISVKARGVRGCGVGGVGVRQQGPQSWRIILQTPLYPRSSQPRGLVSHLTQQSFVSLLSVLSLVIFAFPTQHPSIPASQHATTAIASGAHGRIKGDMSESVWVPCWLYGLLRDH